MNIYKEPDNYVIKFNDVIKNLFSVKLVWVYPKHGTEFYTNLYRGVFSECHIVNQYLVESFTQLPMMVANEYKSEAIG